MSFLSARLKCRTIFRCSLLALLGVIGARHADPALAAPDCNAHTDPYSESVTDRQACGLRSFARENVERVTTGLARGSTAYNYMVDGLPMSYFVPPASFDPATASADALRALGIPTEPPASNPDGQALWLAMVHNMKFVAPPTTIVSVPGVTVPGPTANATSSNWSGIINTGGAGAYSEASATYYEPVLGSTSCSNNSAVFWDGLGGNVGSSHLAQNGTAVNVSGLGQHQGWTEVLPAQQSVVAQPISASAGHSFLAETVHNSGNTFHFYFYNYYTAQALDLSVTADGYDGSTAEYIAERPSYSGHLYGLTNFQHITFEQTQTNGKSSHVFGYQADTMYNGSDVLAIPHNYDSSGKFEVDWYACL